MTLPEYQIGNYVYFIERGNEISDGIIKKISLENGSWKYLINSQYRSIDELDIFKRYYDAAQELLDRDSK